MGVLIAFIQKATVRIQELTCVVWLVRYLAWNKHPIVFPFVSMHVSDKCF